MYGLVRATNDDLLFCGKFESIKEAYNYAIEKIIKWYDNVREIVKYYDELKDYNEPYWNEDDSGYSFFVNDSKTYLSFYNDWMCEEDRFLIFEV